MQKSLTYVGFIISCVLIILAFITAKTYAQLVIAIVLYPLLAYFALKLFPRKSSETPMLAVQMPTPTPAMPINNTVGINAGINKGKVEIVDIDKRTFLKLLGTAGVSFFIFSILGRRAEDFIFNKALNNGISQTGLFPDTQAPQTDALVTEGYRISEIDDDIISYYGFINKDGKWLIMREDSENNSFRYANGEANFSDNWSRRQKLKYDYYYNLF